MFELLGLPRMPQWVKPYAVFDLDFENQRYFGGDVAMAIASSFSNKAPGLIDGSQSSGGYSITAGGLYVPTPYGSPRITPGYGMWSEEARTMSCLWNRDFTNAAWVKTTMTAAKTQAGIDGKANQASLLTATGANATVLQTITLASQINISSVFIKRVSGTGTISITQDNGATWTDVTALVAAGSTTANGFVRVQTPTQTILNPVVGIQLGTSGDSIAVDFFQQESSNGVTLISPCVPTSPMLNTSGVNARYTEEHTFNSVTAAYINDGMRLIRNIFTNNSPWWCRIKYMGTPTATKKGWLISSDGNVQIFGGADGGTVSFQSAISPNNGNAGFGNWNVLAGRVNGQGSQCALNGGALSTLATVASGGAQPKPVPPSTVITHCGLGNNGGGNNNYPINGVIARITLGNTDITDGYLRDLSFNL